MTGAPQTGLRHGRQRGASLIVTVLLVALIGVTTLLSVARGTESEAEKERRTSEALAMAKEALIGFAGGVVLTGPERPGDLPCPDLDNDGSAELSCDLQSQRLGRLPWRTLGLPDLRDGDGERLWYAVSDNFKNNTRTVCNNHADPGCLNSDTPGTITVRDASGTAVHDATNVNPITHNGIIAVVMAPGGAIQRQGAGTAQDRSCFVAGVWRCNILNQNECLPTPTLTDVPRCNPANYLDYLDFVSGTEDNADFADGTANGFIAGPAPAGNSTVVNDRILTIGRHDLLPVLERRVAQEVALCLKDYATANGQKYPWAADMVNSGFLPNQYHDYDAPAARRYGRVPDPLFTRTLGDDPTMINDTWVGSACKLTAGNWWTNWKSQVLYTIAPAFQPGGSANCAIGGCLTVNRPTGAPLTNVRVVVMVAGRALAGQDRWLGVPAGTVNTNPAFYVEFENATSPVTPDSTFEIRSIDTTFNDRLAYSP